MPLATPQGTLDFKSVDTITFVGASSNTVIDTTTGSFGVGVDANGPTSNLHVVGDALITGNVSDLNIVSNVNMLHTSNTASIKLNSNVVTEFPRSKKLMKFPRVALTQNALNNGYSIVQSPASISGTETRKAWSLFNGVTVGGGGNTYHGNDGTAQWDASGIYTGSESLGGVSGTWLYIRLPVKISLEFVKLTSRAAVAQRTPRSGTFLGSNDGVNWTFLSSFSDTILVDPSGSSSPEYTYTYNVNSTVKYDYIGFVMERIGNSYPNFEELELYGTPEYDPEANGVDVVVKSVPNVPNTDWLEVYYDAKDLVAGGVTSVNDLKPSSLGSAINSSSVTNVTVSDEAFVFNGSSSGINATLSNPQGPWVHSVSVWVKLGKDHSDYTGDNVFSLGNAASNAQLESLRIHSNDVRFITFQGGADPTYSLPMDRDRWYHFTLTYDGGAATNSFKLFRDGIESTGTTTTTPIALNVAANSLLSIGYERVRNKSHFNGSIANFRLFNRALTQDEIYQLYAYQKEYFGHGTLGMTLKAGRLGIGTSEPRAALDVRGDIHGGCPAFWSVYNSASKAGEGYVLFDTVRNKCIKNVSLDGTTGKITIQIAGWYKLDVHGMSYEIDATTGVNTASVGRFGINDSVFSSYIYTRMGIPSGVGVHANASGQSVHYLNVGDLVGYKLSSDTNNSFYGSGYSDFSGFLLSM